ncbi:MAG TPA: hypothetical protein VIY47_06365 [Ignavibacteriaceae bacterium]
MKSKLICMVRPLLIFALLYCFFVCEAQKGKSYDNSLEELPFKERIVTGGGLGLAFGSTQDFISVSPMVGYRVTERLLAGTGITFRYTKYKYYQPALSLTDWGFNPFLRYTIFKNIFLHAEYEYLNYEFPTTPEQSVRKAFNSFLAGGGFLQPIGDKAAFYITALYNFSYKDPLPGEYSPYYSPLILRAGISMGF